MDQAVAGRLGRLCNQAADAQLLERAERYGVADILGRIVSVVRGESADATLESDLDLLDDVFARNGIDGLTTGVRGYEQWRGGGHPVVPARVCPASRPCSRVMPVDQADPPACALTGTPFTVTRIRL